MYVMIIIVVGLVAAVVATLEALMITNSNLGSINRGGISGQENNQFFGGMPNMMINQGQEISIDKTAQMMKDVPMYAKVIPENNSIVYDSQNIKLIVLATDHEGAINLTSNRIPGYASDDVFVIYGLVNPTLVIHHGVTTNLDIIVVNLDKDMYHNFVFTSLSPPYSYMVMQGMMNKNPQQQGTIMQMTPYLPPLSQVRTGMVAHEYMYSVQINMQTNLWYFCTYPGHAQSGMYGKVLVN